MTNERADDPWVHPKACDRRHEEEQKFLTLQHTAVMSKLGEIELKVNAIENKTDGVERRLYRDNGQKSVQTKQYEHDLAIMRQDSALNTLAESLEDTSEILRKIAWWFGSTIGALALGGLGYLLWVGVRHMIVNGIL